MYNVEFGRHNVSLLVCVGMFVCGMFYRLSGVLRIWEEEDKWVYSALIVQCHLSSHPSISLSPCIVRVVVWVVRPCGVILNML